MGEGSGKNDAIIQAAPLISTLVKTSCSARGPYQKETQIQAQTGMSELCPVIASFLVRLQMMVVATDSTSELVYLDLDVETKC